MGIAWIKQPGSSDSTGVVASAKADALVDGCSSVPPDMTASVTGLSLAKGRVLGWVVGFETDPAVADTTFDGESVDVNVTWRQRPQLEMRLNVSGEVAVKGSAAVTKSKVRQGLHSQLERCRPSQAALVSPSIGVVVQLCSTALRAQGLCSLVCPAIPDLPLLCPVCRLWPFRCVAQATAPTARLL